MTNSDSSSVWYEDWFDRAEYEVVYKNRDEEDARRLLELIANVTRAPTGTRVLDMACGRGRHAIQLARRGFEVTGIDLSPAAIEKADALALTEDLRIDFRVGDMRLAPCAACYDLVVNLFTSFGYFDDDLENEKAVAAMATALVPGGWFVQDFMNGVYWSANFVPHDEREEAGFSISQRRWVEGGRLNKEISLTRPDGNSAAFNESVRLYGLPDFERMYSSAGLEIEHVFGDSDGSEFGDDSRRLIIFSKRLAS